MKKFKIAICLLLSSFTLTACTPSAIYDNRERDVKGTYSSFTPGGRWYDTDGELIQAHGGQVQIMPVPLADGTVEDRYVWVGEDKRSGHLGNCVAMYYSSDLYNWTFGGDVLRSVSSMEEMNTDPYFKDLYADYTLAQKENVFNIISTTNVIERPKMLYNDKTGKYVVWFHNDDNTEQNPKYKYDVGMAGVAISDSPFGPFKLIDRYRLSECPKGQIDCYPSSKGEARDMNLFKDEDGTAYITYTSENNKTLYISKLNEEYTYLVKKPSEAVYGEDYIRIFPGAMREAPVLMKENGRYYLMSSSTTGWRSNQARVWSSDEIFGTWRNDGNPCKGLNANVTFDTQSTSLFQAKDGQWIYYGDRWNRNDLHDSRYVWLPVAFENDKLTIRWESEWQF